MHVNVATVRLDEAYESHGTSYIYIYIPEFHKTYA